MKRKINLIKMMDSEMQNTRAGYEVVQGPGSRICGCGCYYASRGGASSSSNKSANKSEGLLSPLRET